MSVKNQDSVEECKANEDNQSSVGRYEEDYTDERRSQQWKGDNDEYYSHSNVHIRPDSEDEHMEYHYTAEKGALAE